MLNFTMHTATEEHLKLLQELYIKVKDKHGSVVEFGSFEGRSSISLCEVAFPEVLHCVDTWQGGVDGFGNSPVSYINFLHNMEEADCIYIEHKMDMFEYIKFQHEESCKFIYLDASHDYESVKLGIEKCLPLLIPGGILCGDDYLTANKDRLDLHGGVQRAVDEIFKGVFNLKNNMWWIVKE
jgi:predicted O-methyltransferase YrrM